MPSAMPWQLSGKPSASMSRWLACTMSPSPFCLNSAVASSHLCLWNSNVCTLPVGATALARLCVRDPLPVPDSKTYTANQGFAKTISDRRAGSSLGTSSLSVLELIMLLLGLVPHCHFLDRGPNKFERSRKCIESVSCEAEIRSTARMWATGGRARTRTWRTLCSQTECLSNHREGRDHIGLEF